MPTPAETTAAALSQAITAFDQKRAAIIAKAFAQGGADQVNRVIAEYNVLRDASFELTRRELDANNSAYTELLSACKAETTALTDSIAQLQQISDILNAAAKVISLVGRILIVLGV